MGTQQCALFDVLFGRIRGNVLALLSSYDVAGAVSDHDLRAMRALATELNAAVRAWLKRAHPELGFAPN
jgi:hypothetical protein